MRCLKIFHIQEGPKGGVGGGGVYGFTKKIKPIIILRFTIRDSHFTVYEDNTKIYSYILIFT